MDCLIRNRLIYVPYMVVLMQRYYYYILTIPSELESRNETFRLEDFTYSNNDIMTTIFSYIEQSDFTGITVSSVPTNQLTHTLVHVHSETNTALFNSYTARRCCHSSLLFHHRAQWHSVILGLGQ